MNPNSKEVVIERTIEDPAMTVMIRGRIRAQIIILNASVNALPIMTGLSVMIGLNDRIVTVM